MFCKTLLLIVLVKTYTIQVVDSQYLETELSYQKPKLEKNNIVNKGVWVRNKFNEDLTEKDRVNNFIFRENSLDVDNLLQNNFDAFGGNYMQDIPFVSAYSERQKRSNRYWNKRPRKSLTGKNIRTRHSRQNNEFENADSAQKVINDLQPSLVFNEYPYEVAILSNMSEKIENNETTDATTLSNLSVNDIISEPTTESIDTEIKNTSNESNKNITSPKRSMKYDFETEIIKKIEFTEDLNKTENNNNDNKVIDRNVFDKDNSEWHQNAPIPDVNMYKVVPKEPVQKSKPVTERGLLKVISMLTKTFKKIVKQHGEIKDIHTSIADISDEFKKKIALFASKFQDFDLKYLYLLKFHDKMKEFDEKLATREEYFLSKEKDIAKSFKEFESQQKKFLLQQKQFYNIQKLMLAQNEKINSKQNLIAKTQSEISHRQNNFARILKKAKQLYTDSRNPAITKLSSSITKTKDITQRPPEQPQMQTSTQSPDQTTESVKINLFSIPTSNKIQQDPDELILKEKDDQAIDDLVYKYYFNNTFIDSFMRSQVLNSFMGNSENGGNTSSAKHKRKNLETTILLPILEANESEIYGHKRERRWINHHHSRHSKRRRDKKTTPTYIINTTEYISKKPVDIPFNMIEQRLVKENNVKSDPFLTMATSFCNEMHQNSNQQTLRWCIEKALRRLKFLETKMMPVLLSAQLGTSPSILLPSPTDTKLLVDNKQNLLLNMIIPRSDPEKKQPSNEERSTTNGSPSITTAALSASDSTTPPVRLTPLTLQTVDIPYTNQPAHIKVSADTWNFPDNDELELKIKEYDLTPDTEGNVYFEGSIHASDLAADSESGVDDIMPGLDSNSRVDVDPLAFDLQAKRRAFVRKLNERIKMSLL